MYPYVFNPPLGIFILRVILGIIFVRHGYPKLFQNFSQFSGWLKSMGIKPSKFWALVVGVTEFFGGILLILGILVPVATFGIAIDMVVAIIKVKWGKAKLIDPNGWELDLVYLTIAVVLIISGAGSFAIFPI